MTPGHLRDPLGVLAGIPFLSPSPHSPLPRQTPRRDTQLICTAQREEESMMMLEDWNTIFRREGPGQGADIAMQHGNI